MDYDAFTGGIAPGGLRNKDEIKILVCYLLLQVGTPLSKDMVTQAILYDSLANYFEIGDAIYDLVRRKNVKSDLVNDQEILSLTPNGRNIAEKLRRDLPLSVRERAVKAALRMLTRERNERENRVELLTEESGIYVRCSVLDGETELMQLKLFVGDAIQAEQVKNAFYDQPGLVYSAAIATLTDDYKMLSKMLNDKLNPEYKEIV